jgi:hypothetical protein
MTLGVGESARFDELLKIATGKGVTHYYCAGIPYNRTLSPCSRLARLRWSANLAAAFCRPCSISRPISEKQKFGKRRSVILLWGEMGMVWLAETVETVWDSGGRRPPPG